LKHKKNSKNAMPAMMFYPGDWLKDPAVRMLTLAQRGLWIEMLALMYESPERGFLSLQNGKPVTEEQLARMVGGEIDFVKNCLTEMEQVGVFSRTQSGIIYSRRMVGDEKLRAARSEAGKKGMANRYNKTGNKDTTPLEDENEAESVNEIKDVSYNSSSKYLTNLKARQQSEDVNIAMEGIPKNKLSNPVKTKEAIINALDRAGLKEVNDRIKGAKLLRDRLEIYYRSKEGKGEFFKAPHNFLNQDCHLADPSTWDARQSKENNNWENIKQ
jgi:hypothetical protein